MKIDYISDLHVDQNVSHYSKVNDESISRFVNELCERKLSDTILIGGDISNDNNHTITTLVNLKKHYENVVFVPGNHDHWIIGNCVYSKSSERIGELLKFSEDIEGLSVLYGDTIEIDGLKIGGTTGWNDYYYGLKVLGEGFSHIHNTWSRNWVDSKYCKGVDSLIMNSTENEKIKRMYGEVDILLTHFCPYINIDMIPPKYRESIYTSFFYFDTREILSKPNSKTKAWIFGHTHEVIDQTVDNIKYLCNPHGYRFELFENPDLGKIRTLDI